MAADSPTGETLRRVLFIALGTCVALVLIDLLGGLLRKPETLSTPFVLMDSARWCFIAFGILYTVMLLLLGPYLIYVARLNPVRCAVSISTFWITGLILTSATLGAQMPRSSAEMRTLLLCGLGALIAGVVTYPIATRLARSQGICGRHAVVALFLLATVVAVYWLSLHVGGGLVVLLSAVALVCLFVSVSSEDEGKRFRRGAAFLVWPIAIVACVGAGSMRVKLDAKPGALSASEVRVPRVILIVVDTLRANALSCYGQTSIETPHIDRFAEQSVRFAHPVSAAPWTVPGTGSLMTGLSPLVHGVREAGGVVPDNVITLAEYLQDAGYRTAVIGQNPTLIQLSSNLGQGFGEYRMFPRGVADTLGDKLVSILFLHLMGKAKEVTTTELTDMAIDWVDTHAEEPFFFWLHYFDPHLPYAPPAKYIKDTEPSPQVGNYFVDMPAVRSGYLVPDAADRKRIEQLYLAEVRYVDDQINRFLQFLIERDLYEDSLIILTSDHGEEFWEHGGFEHGHTVYGEVLNVPLIVKTPGGVASGVVDQPVSTVSVVPTILEICGVEFDPKGMTGRSLTPLMVDTETDLDLPPILSTGLVYYENRVGLRFDGLKYIRYDVSGREELYDLRADPFEQNNLLPLEDKTPLLTARALVAERMQDANRLKDLWELGEPEVVELDDATRSHLKSLGYVGD